MHNLKTNSRQIDRNQHFKQWSKQKIKALTYIWISGGRCGPFFGNKILGNLRGSGSLSNLVSFSRRVILKLPPERLRSSPDPIASPYRPRFRCSSVLSLCMHFPVAKILMNLLLAHSNGPTMNNLGLVLGTELKRHKLRFKFDDVGVNDWWSLMSQLPFADFCSSSSSTALCWVELQYWESLSATLASVVGLGQFMVLLHLLNFFSGA